MRFPAVVGGAVAVLLGGALVIGCGSDDDSSRDGVAPEDSMGVGKPADLDGSGVPSRPALDGGTRTVPKDPTDRLWERPKEKNYGGSGGHGGTGGSAGDQGGGHGGDDCPWKREENDRCDDRHCFDVDTDQDISYLLVDVPCPDAVDRIVVTDRDTGREVGSAVQPNQPSAAECDERITGFKIENVNTRRAEICIETSEEIDSDAITIQVKAGQLCEFVVEGHADSCECKDGDCVKPPKH